MVADSFGERCHVHFFEHGSDRDVLEKVRDLVHQQYRVLTAPLSGSVKPWETPYRSIMVSAKRGSSIDATSLDLIERAMKVIDQSRKRLEMTKPSIDQDFQVIDLSLIESALPSAEAIGRV